MEAPTRTNSTQTRYTPEDAIIDPPTNLSFQPTPPAPAGHFAGSVDWNMQDLVWNNLPWDWDLVDDLLVDPLAARSGNGGAGGSRGRESRGEGGTGPDPMDRVMGSPRM
jgi:hypothetical protein